MDNRKHSRTCVSSGDHRYAVRDVCLHYFGCLKVTERDEYFNSLLPHEKERINTEQQNINEQRAFFDGNDETKPLVQSLRTSLNQFFRNPTERREPIPAPTGPCKENAFGMNAYMAFFENSEPFHHPSSPEKFPDQKIPIVDLLYNKDKTANPLMRPCEKDEFRYFHLPTNNMEWVEEAIARHYNGERPDHNDHVRIAHRPSNSRMILQPEFWHGHQNGNAKDNVHTRSMKPRCDVISIGEDSQEPPKNIAIFMPYLYWETERQYSKFEVMIREIEEAKRAESKKDAEDQLYSQNFILYRKPEVNYPEMRTFSEVIETKLREEIRRHPNSRFSKSKIAQYFVHKAVAPATILGQVLYRAALVAKAMGCYSETQLLKTYLYHDPPLHPRRSLDQFNPWTERLKRSIKDQVVYEATALHHGLLASHRKNPHSFGLGMGHYCKCDLCLSEVRKVPRIIMVDQLWLWILDENTVITSFPQRHGRNESDVSDVHKSIRIRLALARKNEIRSVYDLAFIIIDQCSQVLFDTSRPINQQAEVLEIFTNTIGFLVNQRARVFRRFWDILQLPMSSRGGTFSSNQLTDILQETILLRKAKDVSMELQTMISVMETEKAVLGDFLANLRKRMFSRSSSIKEQEEPEEIERYQDNTYSFKGTTDLGKATYKRQEARLTDLHKLVDSVKDAEQALEGLIPLKQQQAGVLLAHAAVRQSEIATRQGTSIIVFTVVTIVFLPLSFIASIFGMNAAEFNSGLWGLKQESIYMFPISLAVIFISFSFAFFSFPKAITMHLLGSIFYMLELAWTKLIIVTGIDNLSVDFTLDDEYLAAKRRGTIECMKLNARDQKKKAKMEKEIKEEARTQKSIEKKQELQRRTGLLLV